MKKWLIFTTIFILVILTACSNAGTKEKASTAPSVSPAASASADASPSPTKSLRVAFVYNGVPGDGGWTYQHEIGRLYLEKELNIKTTVVENVAEADSERVFAELAQKNDVIFGTTYGFMDPMANVAQKYPNVKFLNNTGYKTAPNMGNYMGRGYETSYLAGIAAAKMTKNNHIGYVAPFPIPEIMYTLNAFALGAQSVNPNINVSIVWSSAWDDPTRERQAAISLLDQNVDVLGAYQNTPAALMATAERGKFGIGAHANMDHFAPEAYITNPVWNWGPYYVNTIKQIMDGTWKPESYFGSMKDGVVDMAPFGKNVPKDVVDLVNKKKEEILAGNFQVFKGPLYDQSGKERVAKDAILTDEQILSMDWFVKGIKGSIPKS